MTHITVFGAGRPSVKEKKVAYAVGKFIAENGHTLFNGGYGGTMAASAEGCRSAGGTVIGICIKENKIHPDILPNTHSSKIIEVPTLLRRIERLLKSECVIVLDGSLGTLQELISTMATHFFEKKKKNIIILGKRNQALIQYLYKNHYVNQPLYRHIAMPKTLNEFKTTVQELTLAETHQAHASKRSSGHNKIISSKY